MELERDRADKAVGVQEVFLESVLFVVLQSTVHQNLRLVPWHPPQEGIEAQKNNVKTIVIFPNHHNSLTLLARG
jgi:hypothetical protein